MVIPFTKMQALGNDFVVIESVRQPVSLTTSLIRKMADRHFGIGFDQLLLIEPTTRSGVDFEYRIFNADAGEVSQCGNGARCVGRFIWENNLADKPRLVLGTLERLLEVSLQPDNEISVNMGIPLFEPAQIPFLATEKSTNYLLELGSQSIDIGVVNLGNPHAVIEIEDVNNLEINEIGKQIESHPRFPQRVNVGFVEYVNRSHIRLRVFERGVGETLACGSGACAAVAVGRQSGKLEQEVMVELLGGRLTINWPGELMPILMRGPAELVFRGEWLERATSRIEMSAIS